MSVNLQKGQKVDLTKGNEGLNQIMIGLGWDEAKKSAKGFIGGLFGGAGAQNIDCDASAILCKNGRCENKQDVIYFGNLKHGSGAVKHMGDNLTGAGEGDDEQIKVELNKIPEAYDKIIFVVNIYQAIARKQDFGMIENAFIRIVDLRTNMELCRYNLSENYGGMHAVVFGEVYRKENEWKFNAIGQGTQEGKLEEIVRRYQ